MWDICFRWSHSSLIYVQFGARKSEGEIQIIFSNAVAQKRFFERWNLEPMSEWIGKWEKKIWSAQRCCFFSDWGDIFSPLNVFEGFRQPSSLLGWEETSFQSNSRCFVESWLPDLDKVDRRSDGNVTWPKKKLNAFVPSWLSVKLFLGYSLLLNNNYDDTSVCSTDWAE